MLLRKPTAMNLLHGDHAAVLAKLLCFAVAKIGSHEIGNPRTTLARGRTYGLYSLCTIDSWGDIRRAE